MQLLNQIEEKNVYFLYKDKYIYNCILKAIRLRLKQGEDYSFWLIVDTITIALYISVNQKFKVIVGTDYIPTIGYTKDKINNILD